jgi:hypothetical protein
MTKPDRYAHGKPIKGHRRCIAIKIKGLKPGERGCSNPVTYSEHGHRFAGNYCDAHGHAVHNLRRGSECFCRHCVGRANCRRRESIAAQEAAKEAEKVEA